MPRVKTIDDVLLRLVIQEDGCWIWPGKKRRDGYGVCRIDGKDDIRVHRAVYEHFCGPVPAGLVLDHVKERCNSRACANFEHLEPCGIIENVLRAHPDLYGKAGRAKTHCSHGHPLSGENLVVDRNRGFRSCRICRYAAKRRYRARQKMR